MSSKTLFGSVLVLASCVSAPAFAGDMSPVDVYGKAHISGEALDNGHSSSLFVSSNSTRIGFRGEQDLGIEGASAIWQYENDVDIDGGGSVWSTRNSFAGFKGNFGKLIMGRHDTPMKTLGRKVDFFGDRLGDARNATVRDSRLSNIVMYSTPKLADAVTVAAMYTPEEGAKNSATISANAMYNANGVFAGVAVENLGKAQGLGEAETNIRGAASFDAGQFKIAGLFQTISNFAGEKDASSMTFGGGASFDATEKVVVRAQAYVFDPCTDEDNDGSTLAAFGVDHNYSKKVTTYVVFSMTVNQDHSSEGPFGGGHGQKHDNPVELDETDPLNSTVLGLGENQMGVGFGTIIKF